MTPLLHTKLAIPAPRPHGVVRPRLMTELDSVRRHKLLLLSAPAGFGKTTLAAAYAHQANRRPDTQVAWLTLEPEENDPARFLAYLQAALLQAGAPLPEADEQPSAVGLLNGLTAVLAAHPDRQILLILDDLHHIHNQAVHQTLSTFIDHLPARAHLLLATRADPPLPLARWRAQGQLRELRQQSLRFTPEETTTFLQQALDQPLPTEAIVSLTSRTEGWVAGLQMALVSLREQADPQAFIDSFSGSHRFILDYLMEEVVNHLPPKQLRFLLHTAVLDQLNGALCAALLSEPGAPVTASQAQETLAELEAANLFLLPLDEERRWFRTHRLFADLLLQRLIQTEPQRVPLLHKRAASWYTAHDLLEEAIPHALKANDYMLAADLMAELAEPLLMRSQLITVQGWLAALPEAVRAERPLLSLYYAWTLMMQGRAQTEVEVALRPVTAEGAPGELVLVRSVAALMGGQGMVASQLAQQALDQIAEEHRFLQGFGHWILALSFLFSGALEAGIHTLEKAVALSRQAGNITIAVSALGRLANQAWREGDLQQAERIYRQALQVATRPNKRPLPIGGEAHIGLSRIYYEWNQLDKARAHVTAGLALAAEWRALSTVGGNLLLARIEQAEGHPEAAHQALERAGQVAEQTLGTPYDDLAVAIYTTLIHLQQGNLTAVERWLRMQQIPERVDPAALTRLDNIIEGHMRKYEFVILVRLRLLQHQPRHARELLQPLLANAQRLRRCDLQIECHVLSAVAAQQLGELAVADRQLAAALDLGEVGGFVRLFVEAGEEMGELLTRQPVSDAPRRAYLKQLQAACSAAAPEQHNSPALVEPLSPRELEILALIAAGSSNREIAAQLVLSLATVKWHASNIYGKLAVTNRTAAVARARELDLL